MRVQTYRLTVEFLDGLKIEYPKLSRVAVKRYKEWFETNCQVLAFVTRENDLKRSHNWLAET